MAVVPAVLVTVGIVVVQEGVAELAALLLGVVQTALQGGHMVMVGVWSRWGPAPHVLFL